ncbi:hypothetical protein [Sphingomonas sp. PvP056]|uniref:hypothetical protein n=1 Tax=Sphingomonas sp. PvP056 TaxID=3156392 RepID=UPI003396B75D
MRIPSVIANAPFDRRADEQHEYCEPCTNSVNGQIASAAALPKAAETQMLAAVASP